MNIQRLLGRSLLASAIVIIGTTSASGQSSETIFFCQTNEEIPTTVAQTKNGNLQPIFHWKSDALPEGTNPDQLCNTASQQLENYLASESDLSAVNFKSTKLDKIPVICATGETNDCNLVLLTLPPSEQPIETANLVLDSILEPQLQGNRLISNERGVQSIYYKINLWQLLGF
ncbi:MAG: COP23 domain-containing protein [Xenococcus sp. (in: cyanobacteria)]